MIFGVKRARESCREILDIVGDHRLAVGSCLPKFHLGRFRHGGNVHTTVSKDGGEARGRCVEASKVCTRRSKVSQDKGAHCPKYTSYTRETLNSQYFSKASDSMYRKACGKSRPSPS